MSGALMMSGLLHLGVFLFAAFGLPFVVSPPPLPSPPISVEIVQVSEMSATPRLAKPVKPPEEKMEDIPEPPPAPKKPEPPTMTEAVPPDLMAPVPVPQEETTADPVPAQPVPLPSKKPKPPEKKTEAEATKKPAEAQTQDFQSLLRNLTPEKTETEDGDAQDLAENASPEAGQIAPPGQTMTMSEEDALRRQLGRCWNVMAGAKYAEDLVVEIRVQINQDRTVRQATILDQGRYNRDGPFRAAAESALRALRNPLCTPLQLPPDKYEHWKTTTIRFDPREML